MLIPTRILAARLRRWRTGRGFGVHSPFAYYFITRVLRERLPYYDFERLPEISSRRISDRDSRMIYRLSAFFRPDTVNVSGRQSNTALSIVMLAHPSARAVSSPETAQMAIYAGCDTMPATAREVTVVFSADSAVMSGFRASLSEGMTFYNSKIAVAVIRHGLPRQEFCLKF